LADAFEEAASPRRRWDPIVKLTHWGIVVAVIANALFTRGGSGWHIWVGYGLAALLALRLLWGIIGPAEARFGSFPPSPSRAIRHISEIRRGEKVRHSSHNPLGALMVYAIWACLAVIVATGIAMSGPPPANPNIGGERAENEHALVSGETSDDEHEESGWIAGREQDSEGEEVIEEVHELAANLLYVLIALHLLGVMFETRRSGREVVLAMLPGGNRGKA
jgi:cytochrome b